MKTKHVFFSLIIIAIALVLASCTGTAGPVGPAGPAGAAGAAGPAGPAGPAGAAAAPAATSAVVAVATQLETCATCHVDAGAKHQASYDELYQDGIIKVTDVAYTFTAPNTHVISFKVTKEGAPFDAALIDSLAIYYVPWTGKAFQFEPVADRLDMKGKIVCDGTGKCTSTQTKTDAPYAKNYSAMPGLVVVYGRDEQVGTLPARVSQSKYPFAAILKTGTVDYVSAANNSGCVKCHTDPYLKHGYIYAEVNKDPKTDFLTCKACHLDNGVGGHYEWQLAVDDPALGAAYAADPKALTDEKAKTYAYKTSLMNDVHMSHAMEFPYPQSMSNCATCHEGKLETVLSDANFKIETCKSCHPATGVKKLDTDGKTVLYDTTKLALKTILPPAIHGQMNLDTTDCTSCHKKGGTARTFNAIHTGYDTVIYAAAGQKYSDAIKITIDSAAVADNKLTIKFSAAAKPEIKDLDITKIVPTVMVGMYGWDTKDYIIGPHERLVDDNGDKVFDAKDSRNLEFIIDGKDANPRFKTVSSAGGKWEVVADMSNWASLIKDGTVKRVEIAVMPALTNANKVMVALNATSKTFDLAKNKFDEKFYGPIVDVKGCNTCHDALGTTFHTPDRGGSVVVCRMCHITKAGGSHLEMQSRSIDSYVHAIHSGQAFDLATINFADPIAKMEYNTHIESTFPSHGTNCMACHVAGAFDVPDQSKALPGLESASAVNKTLTRKIGTVPQSITGPASRACGGCHRAVLINEDSASGLITFNQHIKQGGYLIDAGKDPDAALQSVIKEMMTIFK